MSWLDMTYLKNMPYIHIVFAALILLLGYWFSKWLSGRVGRIVTAYLSNHEGLVCQRLIFYGAMLLFLITGLQQLGFKLGVLLGAAGVFTVGIGFAAQTSLANVISGLFLLIEHPFKIGNTITVKGYTGIVESIDLLSTRLRTADNTLVRIPNQNIMQAEIINLNYFPKRRVDLVFGVAYGTNVEKVRKILMQLATDNVLTLQDPEPQVSISDFGASSLSITFTVWGSTGDYSNLKSTLQESIKIAFEKEGIELPFPQMTVHYSSQKQHETTA